jgi:hypothetical protein
VSIRINVELYATLQPYGNRYLSGRQGNRVKKFVRQNMPAVRPRFHLPPCSKIRSHLCNQPESVITQRGRSAGEEEGGAEAEFGDAITEGFLASVRPVRPNESRLDADIIAAGREGRGTVDVKGK